MTDFKISADSRVRIDTMVKTNNGFEISETDLKIRGPGDLMGTQQSGALDLLIADLGRDRAILQDAREAASAVQQDDPELQKSENREIKTQIDAMRKKLW